MKPIAAQWQSWRMTHRDGMVRERVAAQLICSWRGHDYSPSPHDDLCRRCRSTRPRRRRVTDEK